MSLEVLPAEPNLKWKRGVNRISVMLMLLYALLCAGSCAFQRRLIYFPTKLDPSSAEKAAEREGFLAWRNKSGQISRQVEGNLFVLATEQPNVAESAAVSLTEVGPNVCRLQTGAAPGNNSALLGDCDQLFAGP